MEVYRNYMDNKILQINDIIEPQVDYRGSVKILYIDKSSGKTKTIKRHNKGGKGLFTAICRSLVGLDVTNYVPSYIYGYNSKDALLFTQKITYASTPMLYNADQGREKLAAEGTEANIVQYTFLVPITSLRSTSESIRKLKLFNNNNEECAVLELDEHSAISTNLGANILIYWKLRFANLDSTT